MALSKGRESTFSGGQWNPLYPCFGMPVKLALELKELQPHDVLLEAGKLKEWKPGMIMIFVSHQWRGRRHPDPGMKQFRILQSCLRNIIEGKCKVESNWMSFLFFDRDEKLSADVTNSFLDAYIWYDYFCVPQLAKSYDPAAGERLMRAVNSIPEYVCMCQYFFVLCPELIHENGKPIEFLTWQKRGWCRMEEYARRLGHFDQMVVVVTGEDQAFLHESQDYLSHPVAEGNFSCCEMGHICDGTPIPCDKEKVAVIVKGLLNKLIAEKRAASGLALDKKSQTVLAAGPTNPRDLFQFRLLKSLTPNLLHGLPMMRQLTDTSVVSFVKQVTPTLLDEEDALVTHAARYINQPAVAPVSAHMLAVSEYANSTQMQIEGDTTKFLQDYLFSTTTPSSILCECKSNGKRSLNDGCVWGPLFFAILQGNFDVAADLIRLGEDVDQLTSGQAAGILVPAGSTPLHVVSYLLHDDRAANFLLKAKANPNAKNSKTLSPLCLSCVGGHVEITVALLKGGADHTQGDHMDGQPLLSAASFSRYDCMKALLDANADVLNDNIFGACPLHGSAQAGNHEALCYLLDRRADVDQKHVPRTAVARVAYFAVTSALSLGVNKPALEGIGEAQFGTALMSAALHGQSACVSELISRRADINLKNHRGKTAYDLAQMRMHRDTALLLSEYCEV